jgi:hypothetical protein
MEFMNADGWNDTHVDPITVPFDGDGRFEG